MQLTIIALDGRELHKFACKHGCGRKGMWKINNAFQNKKTARAREKWTRPSNYNFPRI